MAVLIYNVKRNVLSHNLELIARPIHHYRNDIAGLHPVVRLHGLSVGEDAAGFGRLLDAVARRLLHMVHQKLVDTEQLLPLVGHKTEMLEHLAGGIARNRGTSLRSIKFVKFVEIVVKFGHGG